MNHYAKSVLIHIGVLLLLLGLWQITPSAPVTVLENAVVIDFSQTAKATGSKAVKTPRPESSSKAAPKKEEPKKQPIEKQSQPTKPEKKAPLLKSSQKPEEAVLLAKVRQEEAALKAKEEQEKKRIEELERQKAQEEADEKARQEELAREKAEAEAEAKKSEKRSFFRSLLNKSKSASTSEEDNTGNAEKDGEGESVGQKNPGNIEGAIGARRVTYIPTINDNTQIEGTVVIKICVNAQGNVISSKYTQVGSTTANAHLIKLAEEGAAKYKFSPSTKERDCGRVLIDFRLRA